MGTEAAKEAEKMREFITNQGPVSWQGGCSVSQDVFIEVLCGRHASEQSMSLGEEANLLLTPSAHGCRFPSGSICSHTSGCMCRMPGEWQLLCQ